MKLTSPADKMIPSQDEINKSLEKFELLLAKEPSGQQYYHLIIDKELSKGVCDAVSLAYSNVGWRAECKTSSMNGERPGLTGLILQKAF